MKAALVLLLCLVAVLATANGEACEPGTSVKRGCNTCSCTSNGVLACTKKSCPPPRNVRDTGAQECVPGSNFKRDCNDCFCTNEGKAACTKMDCNNQ
ncbi:serine protease inhibitor I/II-like [Bacillus rossius redtenbacheri]|uniref:serine protease inhibitor I/II-like n=1 Tax=Bacillus rossius redtenbacheri TaxID=93214 RepID=UPI002FDE4AFB